MSAAAPIPTPQAPILPAPDAASSPSPNQIAVQSAPHLQSLLSADLTRPSLLHFTASWAEPCEALKKVVDALARAHPRVLVLDIDADELGDVVDEFEIMSVPTCILLRGHTLLSRIEGADASKLAQDVATYARAPPTPALSKTDRKPIVALEFSDDDEEEEDEDAETPEQLEQRLRDLMNQDRVVLFMKGEPDAPRCGFSRKTVAILREQDVEFSHFDILTDERVRSGLKVLNEWPTFPQLIVNGEFVGGLDIIQEMVDNGEFAEVVKGAKAE